MIGDALGRQRGEAVFQLTEVARAADLAAIRHAEDEIAEPEMLHHEATQLLQQRRRVLDEKGRADGARQRLVLDAARLQHHRHVGLAHTNTLREIETGVACNLPVTGKFDVRNHAQNVLFVIDEVLPGLLVRPAQQDLRLRLHPHQLVREIHALRHQAVGVVHQLGVNGRQERRVVPDVVFDDQNSLHAELPRVVHDIPPILDVLDDGGDQTDVALPQEHAIEWRRPAWLEQLRDFTHVVGEDDDGGVDARLAHAVGEGPRRHVAEVARRDDEIVASRVGGERHGLVGRGHVCDARRVPDVQVEELLEDDLVQLTVLGQDERIVQAGDEQDVVNAESGQIGEAREFHCMDG